MNPKCFELSVQLKTQTSKNCPICKLVPSASSLWVRSRSPSLLTERGPVNVIPSADIGWTVKEKKCPPDPAPDIFLEKAIRDLKDEYTFDVSPVSHTCSICRSEKAISISLLICVCSLLSLCRSALPVHSPHSAAAPLARTRERLFFRLNAKPTERSSNLVMPAIRYFCSSLD